MFAKANFPTKNTLFVESFDNTQNYYLLFIGRSCNPFIKIVPVDFCGNIGTFFLLLNLRSGKYNFNVYLQNSSDNTAIETALFIINVNVTVFNNEYCITGLPIDENQIVDENGQIIDENGIIINN